uniref:Uncharacterized protein n=1 Tax=Leersia perrieri TaxID=77586 RepID=A0A0D9XL02_9ORYZ
MGYLACDGPPPLPIDPSIAQDLFDPQLKKAIAAQVNKNREFDAFVLYQYRTQGFAEIQQEVTDDEQEQEQEQL